ncbi:MAG: preprotein translocase subunit SecE [Bacillota bacterium]
MEKKQTKSVFSRLGRYLRESRAELRKVIWPSRQETTALTGVVLISVVFVAVGIWLADTIAGLLMGFILR